MQLEIRRAASNERACVRLALAKVVKLRQATVAIDEQVGPVSSVNEVANERLDRRAVWAGLQHRDLRARPLEHPGPDGLTLAFVGVEQRQVCRSLITPGFPVGPSRPASSLGSWRRPAQHSGPGTQLVHGYARHRRRGGHGPCGSSSVACTSQ